MKQQKQILERKFQLEQYARNSWHAVIPTGVTREEILNPAFWALVSQKMRAMDKIECFWEDGSLYVELIVLFATRSEASVKELFSRNLIKVAGNSKATEFKEQEGFKVDFNPIQKWRIVRTSDNVIIKMNIDDKLVAYKELEEYITALSK